MLYKFTLLALLLCTSINSNIADGSRRSLLVTDIPSDTDDGTVDAIDDNDTLDDTEDTDLDATETEGDDTDTDGNDAGLAENDGDDADTDGDDDGDEDDVVGFETTDDSNDIDSTGTTEDDSGSLDSMETTDADSDDDNNDSDSDDDASDDGDDNTEDSIDDDNVDTSEDDDEEEEDECIGLEQTDCNSLEDDGGDRECAYNQVSGDCYGIERREGQYGSGNFDDGYNTAKAQATQDTAHLEAIVGIFAGIVVVLVCIVSGGAWYFYTQHGDGHKKIDFEGDDSAIPSCAYGTDDDEKVNVDIIETGNTVGDPMLF